MVLYAYARGGSGQARYKFARPSKEPLILFTDSSSF